MINKALFRIRQAGRLLQFLITGAWYFILAIIPRFKRKTVKERLAMIAVGLAFLACEKVLRWIDPTAGIFDAGVLQVIPLTLLKYAVYLMVTWSSFNVIWPDLGHFMRHYFKESFKHLTPWQKIVLSCSIYCFLMLMLVLLSALGI